jgi:hypothetical protein
MIEVLLASSARKGTQTAPYVRSSNEDNGVMLILDITAAPSNEETLTLGVEVKDPASGKYIPLTAFAATKKGSELAAGATLVYTLAAGGAETAAVSNHEVQGLPLPRGWRAKVTHSGSAGEWTYTLGALAIG